MKQLKNLLDLKEQDDFQLVITKVSNLQQEYLTQLDKMKIINLGKSQLENKNRDFKLKVEDLQQRIQSLQVEKDLKI